MTNTNAATRSSWSRLTRAFSNSFLKVCEPSPLFRQDPLTLSECLVTL